MRFKILNDVNVLDTWTAEVAQFQDSVTAGEVAAELNDDADARPDYTWTFVRDVTA